MGNISEHLTAVAVDLEQLLLDPNNPRFSELGDQLSSIPEARFNEAAIQRNTRDRMREFGVAELKDTIKTVGFLPMDRIVVREWKASPQDKKYFVVVEGNRRVTALKWLLELHLEGRETFSEAELINYTKLEALLLSDSGIQENLTLILPGLRHVSGIKDWAPYQKAKTIHALRKQGGKSAAEAAQTLGLSTRAANQSYRTFLALEQMKDDEEYGERASPNLYSYFEEAFKRPEVKAWLGWSEASEKFEEEENLREFYSWIIIPEEEGSTQKLPKAQDVRELGKIIKDAQALDALRRPEGSLQDALVRFEVDNPTDWVPRLESAAQAIRGLTPEVLRALDESQVAALAELAEKITRALQDRDLLLRVVGD